MNINEKQNIIDDLHDRLSRSQVVILTDYKGLDVAAMTELRRKLREANVEFRVAKNTLMARASEETDAAVIKELTGIHGVGRWTVEMLLMFALGRLDVFAADDLGIRQAMVGLYGLDEQGAELGRRMNAIAEAWAPHRTLACRYLWRWKEKAL